MTKFRWGLVALVLLVSACAQGYPEIPYERGAANVKTIAILTPWVKPDPEAGLASTVGQSFGLIGALVDAGMNQEREKRLGEMLNAQKFDLQRVFVDRLTVDLQTEGYTITSFAVPRDPKVIGFLAAYPPKSETKVDAYLDLFLGDYGYYASGIGDDTPYRPVFKFGGRLIRADNGTVLMQDAIIYNPLGKSTSTITISPDPDARYTKFDQLVADPVRATQRLRTAVEVTADTFAHLLK